MTRREQKAMEFRNRRRAALFVRMGAKITISMVTAPGLIGPPIRQVDPETRALIDAALERRGRR